MATFFLFMKVTLTSSFEFQNVLYVDILCGVIFADVTCDTIVQVVNFHKDVVEHIGNNNETVKYEVKGNKKSLNCYSSYIKFV